MKILFVGSSSNICQIILKKLKLKNIFLLGQSNFKTNFHITAYTEKNIENVCKKILKRKIKFDRVVFFNGFQQLSTFTYINTKLFNKIYNINVVVPIIFISNLKKFNLLKNNSSFLFIGSVASQLNEIGNSYYSLAKHTLERCIMLLKKEMKNYRFNILSLGLVKNKMSKKLINRLPVNFEVDNIYLDEEKIVKKFRDILLNNRINGKIIKYYGKYKIKN